MAVTQTPRPPTRAARLRTPRPTERTGVRQPAVLDHIPVSVAAAVLGVWAIVIPLTFAIEPAPADPDMAIPWYGVVLGYLWLLAMGTMLVGLAGRSRTGLVAGAAAASLWTFNTVACPVSGHHTFALWWAGSLAGCAILLAATFGALHLTRRAD